MKKFCNPTKYIAVIISAAVLFSGCGGGAIEPQNQSSEVVIPVTFLINADSGENENEELVEAFNEAYEGQYRVEVEWMADTAEGYRSRIKTLNGLDKLPAVITDACFDPDLYELMINHDRLVDLRPYMVGNEGWLEALGEEEIERYEEADGGVYLAPSTNASHSYAGFFYNKTLFEEANITEFPKTWDEFFSCCELLQSRGITPLALHGDNSYWTPLLMATGYLASTPGGMDFLQIQYPQDYTVEASRNLFSMIDRLFEYADEDALYIERTETTRRFLTDQSAIIANGGWMLYNFTDEQKEKIGFAPFPENYMLCDMRMSAWAVTSGYPEDVTEGAIEFLKFKAIREAEQEDAYFEDGVDNVVESEYQEVIKQAEPQKLIPNYQLRWEDGVQEEFLVNELPLYIEGEEDLDTFLNHLNQAVEEINSEK